MQRFSNSVSGTLEFVWTFGWQQHSPLPRSQFGHLFGQRPLVPRLCAEPVSGVLWRCLNRTLRRRVSVEDAILLRRYIALCFWFNSYWRIERFTVPTVPSSPGSSSLRRDESNRERKRERDMTSWSAWLFVCTVVWRCAQNGRIISFHCVSNGSFACVMAKGAKKFCNASCQWGNCYW